MKNLIKIFGILFLTTFILTSCGGTQAKESETNNDESQVTVVDESSVEETTEVTSDCDKFIKDYEEFADSYIKVLKKYKANPSDATIITEYTEMATKSLDMQTQAANCTDPKYVEKMTEIATKMATAAAGM